MTIATPRHTLETLINEAHENSVAHGFWKGPDANIELRFALIHSEISEALEEWRLPEQKRSPLNAPLFECGDALAADDKFHNWNGDCCPGEGRHKPVGFLTELADVAIRIYDLVGGLKISETFLIFFARGASNAAVPVGRLLDEGRALNQLHTCIARASIAWEEPDYDDCARNLAYALVCLHLLTVKVGADLDAAIAIKMAFNKTRPAMHGKRA